MFYVRQPTDDECMELKRMTRQEVGRVSQRAMMVLLSGQRRMVCDIAHTFGADAGTVRHWLRRFNAEGPAGLYDASRCGRPRRGPGPQAGNGSGHERGDVQGGEEALCAPAIGRRMEAGNRQDQGKVGYG
jgi:hypothetical protein